MIPIPLDVEPTGICPDVTATVFDPSVIAAPWMATWPVWLLVGVGLLLVITVVQVFLVGMRLTES